MSGPQSPVASGPPPQQRQRRLRTLLQEQFGGLPQVGQGFFHGVALTHGAHLGALGHVHLLLAVKDRRESLGSGGAHRR